MSTRPNGSTGIARRLGVISGRHEALPHTALAGPGLVDFDSVQRSPPKKPSGRSPRPTQRRGQLLDGSEFISARGFARSAVMGFLQTTPFVNLEFQF